MEKQSTLTRSMNICPEASKCDLVNNASQNCRHYRPHAATRDCLPDMLQPQCPGCVPLNRTTCPLGDICSPASNCNGCSWEMTC